jgi:ABC-type multidrug transport system permease subunit
VYPLPPYSFFQSPARKYDILKPDSVPAYFHSGIYVPLFDMQGWALTLAYYSPLTYLVDLFNASMIGTFAFSPFVDGGVLIVVCGGFILASRVIQTRNMMKGM